MTVFSLRRKFFAWRWWREVLHARWRLWRARTRFERRVIQKRIEGETCQFLIANPTGEAWYARTLDHQSLELRFVREHMLRPGMTVFEVGGHHGHDSIALARWISPKGRLFVFEPVPENAEVIRENCRLNSLDNVEVVQIAVGSTAGLGRISDSSNGKIVHGDIGGIEVGITSLDAFCAERGVFPDLIKIDVEGYELAVLEGARATLKRRPQVQLEMHADQLPDFGHVADDVWQHLDLGEHELWLQRDDRSEPERLSECHLPPGRSHLYLVDPQNRLAA